MLNQLSTVLNGILGSRGKVGDETGPPPFRSCNEDHLSGEGVHELGPCTVGTIRRWTQGAYRGEVTSRAEFPQGSRVFRVWICRSRALPMDLSLSLSFSLSLSLFPRALEVFNGSSKDRKHRLVKCRSFFFWQAASFWPEKSVESSGHFLKYLVLVDGAHDSSSVYDHLIL